MKKNKILDKVNLMFLFLLTFIFAFTDFAEQPMLKEGRFRPIGNVSKEEAANLLAIPPQEPGGSWLPLSELESFDSLSQQQIAEKLHQRYASLEGKIAKKAFGKTLYYPSYRQLKLEFLLTDYPWTYFLIGLYTLSFFSRLALHLAVFLHGVILLSLCYLLERPPVSNMQETLLFVPFIAAFFGLLQKKKVTQMIGSFVAISLLSMNRLTLDPVQAVLDSKLWLTVHVLLVVGSYAFFIFAAGLAHCFLFADLIKKKGPSEALILKALYIGTFLLIPGTILGGVWAQMSWGRFWDWDPKESWAFISSAVYLVVIHLYRFQFVSAFGLAMGALIGLQAITFTWYGVNYLLGVGLHSYGFGTGGQWSYFLFVAFESLLMLIFFLNKKQLTVKG